MRQHEKKTLVVAGVGRCGTSLAMQILDRAGYPCIGEFPSYEGEFNSVFGVHPATISQAAGHAIKIVDPLNCIYRFEDLLLTPRNFVRMVRSSHGLDLTGAYIVYMTRNTVEQAKSQLKLIGMSANRRAIRTMAAGNEKSDISFIRRYKPEIVYRFEDLLLTPRNFVRMVRDLTGKDLDHEAGASAVIRRSPQCYPGFIEEELLR